jgi:putative membrane protein insertion efficiency factor
MNPSTRRQEQADALLSWYKRWISPAFGNSCRFSPTCSEYAAQAVAEHGWLRGGVLALRRLLRCHPLGAAGYDPVPRHDAAARFSTIRGSGWVATGITHPLPRAVLRVPRASAGADS